MLGSSTTTLLNAIHYGWSCAAPVSWLVASDNKESFDVMYRAIIQKSFCEKRNTCATMAGKIVTGMSAPAYCNTCILANPPSAWAPPSLSYDSLSLDSLPLPFPEEFSRLNKNGKGTDDYPSLDTFVALRKNEDDFRWFAFRFLECVAGVNAWKKQKMKVTHCLGL